MPVEEFQISMVEGMPFAEFTFDPARWETIERLAGPRFLTETRADYHGEEFPVIRHTRLAAFKPWAQTIAPWEEHKRCLPGHHLITMTIPMAETQFLRSKYPSITPKAVVGSLAVSLCHKKGTRLRVEIMDKMQDLEIETIANLYTIVTGPGKKGYYVFFYLHGLDNCKCVVAFVHLSPTDEIHMEWVQVIQQESAILASTKGDKATENFDGGVLIYRIPWLDTTGLSKQSFEAAANTLT